MSLYEKQLLVMLSQEVGRILEYEVVDETFIIEGENFRLAFTCSEDQFEIRSIESLTPGCGRKIVGVIHALCDELALEVYASNVKDTAIGFWIAMGYSLGSIDGEYFRVS